MDCWCRKCKKYWSFNEVKSKHFGDYCGTGDYDNWGWEEWDDLVCPNCESVLICGDEEV